uniref:Putative secreted protein n=1 Tax=Ixodes ricinus TaxID=34613 RepID=A0A6B0U058_IXORI
MTAKLFSLITQLLLIFAGHDPASGPCSTSQVRCQDRASAFLYQDAPGPRGFVTSPSFPMQRLRLQKPCSGKISPVGMAAQHGA